MIRNMQDTGASLVVQWLRICLPVQGMQVWALIRELGSHVLQGNQAWALRLLSLHALESVLHKPQLEKTHALQWRPNIAKKKKERNMQDRNKVISLLKDINDQKSRKAF